LFLNIFIVTFDQFELYIKTKQRKSPNYFYNLETVAKEWNNFRSENRKS
jgi:hypothetical protein